MLQQPLTMGPNNRGAVHGESTGSVKRNDMNDAEVSFQSKAIVATCLRLTLELHLGVPT